MNAEPNCPECGMMTSVIIPRPTSTDDLYASTTTGTFQLNTGPTYPPTHQFYKCTNPTCRVSKIKVSWD